MKYFSYSILFVLASHAVSAEVASNSNFQLKSLHQDVAQDSLEGSNHPELPHQPEVIGITSQSVIAPISSRINDSGNDTAIGSQPDFAIAVNLGVFDPKDTDTLSRSKTGVVQNTARNDQYADSLHSGDLPEQVGNVENQLPVIDHIKLKDHRGLRGAIRQIKVKARLACRAAGLRGKARRNCVVNFVEVGTDGIVDEGQEENLRSDSSKSSGEQFTEYQTVREGSIIVGTNRDNSKVPSSSVYFPVCADGRTDTVGEGWGWQNGASCVVTIDSAHNDINTLIWQSCQSAENTHQRFGLEDGIECVVTNITLGFAIEVTSMGDFNDGSWGGGDVSSLFQTEAFSEVPGLVVADRAVQPLTDNEIIDQPAQLASELPQNNPGSVIPSQQSEKTAWSDSYSVDGQCYCDSTFDHGLGNASIDTPAGELSLRQVCADVAARYGQGSASGRTYYNSIQCGHPPYNNAGDEQQCPGIPPAMNVWDGPNCQATGATFNLDVLYETPTPEVIPVTSNGSWWQPKGSDNLTWFMQFQGNINTNADADVFFLDGEVDQSVIDSLKARGKKIMCYISAGSSENWRSDFSSIPQSVIGNDYQGWPGEAWLDISNIDAIAPVMRARLDRCQSKGFDGVDADNVNGYANDTGFNLSKAQAIYFVKWLANESHQRGMAFSLKNSEDIAADLVDDVDMLQTESCAVYSNCEAASVIRDANKPVWMVEYQNVNGNWNSACATAKRLGFSAIYRDVLLTGDGIYQVCGNGT